MICQRFRGFEIRVCAAFLRTDSFMTTFIQTNKFIYLLNSTKKQNSILDADENAIIIINYTNISAILAEIYEEICIFPKNKTNIAVKYNPPTVFRLQLHILSRAHFKPVKTNT